MFVCCLTSLKQELPFGTVRHQVTTLDAQPSNPAVASLLVLVTGLLVVRTIASKRRDQPPISRKLHMQVDDSPNPLQFTQTFQLIPDGSSYYMCVSGLSFWRRTIAQASADKYLLKH